MTTTRPSKWKALALGLAITPVLLAFSPSRTYPPIAETQPVEQLVHICKSKSSYAYHDHYCAGLKRCKASVEQVSIATARSYGQRACKICY